MFSTLLAHQYQGAGLAQAASEMAAIKTATASFKDVSNLAVSYTHLDVYKRQGQTHHAKQAPVIHFRVNIAQDIF